QPVLPARVPARSLPLHARSRAARGGCSRAAGPVLRGGARRARRPVRTILAVMAKARTLQIYTTPGDAALAFYQAFEARDLDAMMATWAEDEDIVCVHP